MKPRATDRQRGIQQAARKVLTRCGRCGAEQLVYCGKIPKRCTCKNCHAELKIDEPIRRVSLRCQCGFSRNFETTLTGDLIEITCHDCGGPVDLQYSKRRDGYVIRRPQ